MEKDSLRERRRRWGACALAFFSPFFAPRAILVSQNFGGWVDGLRPHVCATANGNKSGLYVFDIISLVRAYTTLYGEPLYGMYHVTLIYVHFRCMYTNT